MDKILARKLIDMLNHYDDRLKEYSESRIETLRSSLERADTLEKVNYLQGQILELRKLINLKDEVVKTLGSK